MIKKIAIASVAVLVLAGCASSNKAEEPAPAPAPAVTTAPPVTDSYTSPEDTFLADAHEMNNAYVEATSDSDLLDIGNATCSALSGGNTVDDIVVYLVEEGTFANADQAEAGGMLIAAAVVDLCPEYTSQLQAYIS